MKSEIESTDNQLFYWGMDYQETINGEESE
jgi:hypothetical protein